MSNFFHRIINRFKWKTLTEITDNERLWRAIYNKYQIKESGELKSSYFRDEDGLSCDLASYTTRKKAKRGIREKPWPNYSGLVEFFVKDIRNADVKGEIYHNPLKRDKKLKTRRNYSHCLIKPAPPKETNNKKEQSAKQLTRGQSKILKEKSKIIISPNIGKLYLN